MPLSRREQKERQQDPRHHHVERRTGVNHPKIKFLFQSRRNYISSRGRPPALWGNAKACSQSDSCGPPVRTKPLVFPQPAEAVGCWKCLRNHVKCLADALPLPGGDFDSCGALHVGFCPWFLYVIKISYVGNYVFPICTVHLYLDLYSCTCTKLRTC